MNSHGEYVATDLMHNIVSDYAQITNNVRYQGGAFAQRTSATRAVRLHNECLLRGRCVCAGDCLYNETNGLGVDDLNLIVVDTVQRDTHGVQQRRLHVLKSKE